MKKILSIGDSLSLPGHNALYEDTWFYKLKQAFSEYDFISYHRGGLDTDILTTLGGGDVPGSVFPLGAHCLEFYVPDIVILQLGVVDCAPRLLSKMEGKIIEKLPKPIRTTVVKILKRLRKRSAKRAYVPVNQFKKNLENYFNRCDKNDVKQLIVISISYPDNRMIKQNPEIITYINLYNEIYKEFEQKFNFIKIIYPLDARKYDEPIYDDGYHPNPLGHRCIFEELKKNIANE